MSPHQANTAIRVAKVPEGEFEARVEGEPRQSGPQRPL